MSYRGPYTTPEGPPAGWTRTDQLLWLYPEEDGLDDYYEQHPDLIVFGGAGAKRIRGTSAPVDAWPPSAPPNPPETQGPAAASVSDVSGPVESDRAAE